jgi:hypothetical protein
MKNLIAAAFFAIVFLLRCLGTYATGLSEIDA